MMKYVHPYSRETAAEVDLAPMEDHTARSVVGKRVEVLSEHNHGVCTDLSWCKHTDSREDTWFYWPTEALKEHPMQREAYVHPYSRETAAEADLVPMEDNTAKSFVGKRVEVLSNHTYGVYKGLSWCEHTGGHSTCFFWPTEALKEHPIPAPKRLRIYIAGPMLGREGFNFQAFHAAAKELRAEGHHVVNPAELDELQGSLPTEALAEAHWPQYMKRDIPLLAECDAIHLLPGWQTSVGATLEFLTAFHMGIPVHGDPRAFDPKDIRDIGRVALGAARSIVDTMTANWGNGKHTRGEWLTEDLSSHLLKASRHALTAEGQRRKEALFKQDGEPHAEQALCRAAMAVVKQSMGT